MHVNRLMAPLAIATLVVGLAAPTLAASLDTPRTIIPDWMRMPSQDQLVRYYPKEALRLAKEGDVELSCIATDEGKVTRCKVLSESPEKMGFGAAALETAKYYQMRRVAEDGAPVTGATVVILIPFRLK